MHIFQRIAFARMRLKKRFEMVEVGDLNILRCGSLFVHSSFHSSRNRNRSLIRPVKSGKSNMNKFSANFVSIYKHSVNEDIFGRNIRCSAQKQKHSSYSCNSGSIKVGKSRWLRCPKMQRVAIEYWPGSLSMCRKHDQSWYFCPMSVPIQANCHFEAWEQRGSLWKYHLLPLN